VIGNERTRAPEALKIAFASAGAITITAVPDFKITDFP
jgi:hypothetical protein